MPLRESNSFSRSRVHGASSCPVLRPRVIQQEIATSLSYKPPPPPPYPPSSPSQTHPPLIILLAIIQVLSVSLHQRINPLPSFRWQIVSNGATLTPDCH